VADPHEGRGKEEEKQTGHIKRDNIRGDAPLFTKKTDGTAHLNKKTDGTAHLDKKTDGTAHLNKRTGGIAHLYKVSDGNAHLYTNGSSITTLDTNRGNDLGNLDIPRTLEWNLDIPGTIENIEVRIITFRRG
jgi:hypothetical protein